MAYSGVTLPLTGTGDATAVAAADVVDSRAYQAIKLMDGTEGSTVPVPAKGTTPGSTDHGLITRPIGSTAFPQSVIFTSQPTVTVAGTVGISSGTVTLSSVHTVTVGNPTTAVNVANPTTAVNVANPTTAVTVNGAVGITSGSSAVELTSVGSTRQVGTVNQGTPAGSSADAWWVRTVSTQTGSGGSTSVDATLTSGGSSRQVGTVNQGTPANSSADAWWVRTVTTGSAGGSTTVDLGSGGSTKLVGLVDGQPFSSGQITRTTLNSSAEGQIMAANANRKYAAITNCATGVTLWLGLSTAAVTTAGANAHILVAALQTFTFGGQVGNMPNYTGPIRGRINSTTVVGPVIGIEFA